MPRMTNIFAGVEPEAKEQAQRVLDHFRIIMSNVVSMFLRQVVLKEERLSR